MFNRDLKGKKLTSLPESVDLSELSSDGEKVREHRSLTWPSILVGLFVAGGLIVLLAAIVASKPDSGSSDQIFPPGLPGFLLVFGGMFIGWPYFFYALGLRIYSLVLGLNFKEVKRTRDWGIPVVYVQGRVATWYEARALIAAALGSAVVHILLISLMPTQHLAGMMTMWSWTGVFVPGLFVAKAYVMYKYLPRSEHHVLNNEYTNDSERVSLVRHPDADSSTVTVMEESPSERKSERDGDGSPPITE